MYHQCNLVYSQSNLHHTQKRVIINSLTLFFCSHTNPYRQSTGRKSLPLAQCCDRKVNCRFLISHFSGSIIHQDIIKLKWEAICLIWQTWDLVIVTSIGKLFLRCACYDMAIRNADDKFRYTITPKDNSSFPYSITKTHICMSKKSG